MVITAVRTRIRRIRSGNFAPHLFGVAALLIGLVISLGVTSTLRTVEKHKVDAAFTEIAQEWDLTLRNGISARLELLNDISALFLASQSVERDEFAIFTAAESHDFSGVLAAEWVPRVASADRYLFEQLAAAESLTEFSIKDRDENGGPVRSPDREVHFPVLYVEPLAGNEGVLGFDMASSPDRLLAMELSRDTGEMRLTSPVHLEEGLLHGPDYLNEENGFLAVFPVYKRGTPTETLVDRRANLSGFAVIAFRSQEVFEGILGSQLSAEGVPSVDFQIQDVTDPDSPTVIFHSEDLFNPSYIQLDHTDRLEDAGLESTIEVGGRTWSVVATPSGAFDGAQNFLTAWLALAAGLVISFAAATYVFISLRRAKINMMLVEERTHELLTQRREAGLQQRADHTKLLESASRTRAILDLAVNAFITIDEKGVIESANRAAVQLFGYAAVEMIGQNVSMLMPAPFHEQHDGYLSNYHNTRQKKIIGIGREVVGLKSDGSTFPMELAVSEVKLDGRRIYTGIVTDITERKAAEEFLKESEAAKESLLNAIPDLMFRVNGRLEILGYRAAEGSDDFGMQGELFVGRPIDRVMPAETAEFAKSQITATLETDTAHTFEYQMPVSSESTRVRDFEARVHVSGPDEVIILIRDITERRAVERMKEEFVSTVSHELRTPLTSIRGALGLLDGMMLADASDQVKRMLQIGISNTDRLSRLINDILDLERLEAGKTELELEEFSVAELVEQTVEGLQVVAADAGITLECDVEEIGLVADQDKVTQVLTNLVSNAIKFSGEGQAVTVAARPSDDGIRFSVSDSGRGIPEESLESVFGRFQQVDASDARQKGGTGLGLAICKGIVELHRGRIWVESEPGEGSVFIFVLPLDGRVGAAGKEAA